MCIIPPTHPNLLLPSRFSLSQQARAIRERIGFSENIMNDTYLDQEYQEVSGYKMNGWWTEINLWLY